MEIDGINLAVGGGAITAIAGVAGAWIKAWSARHQKTEIAPSPLAVELKDAFVSRREFDAHVADNARDLENVFCRLTASDKLTARIAGCLEAIQGDLSLIKQKLFGGKK